MLPGAGDAQTATGVVESIDNSNYDERSLPVDAISSPPAVVMETHSKQVRV